MTEEWRPILGYEGIYEVSDHGRVRSLDRIDANGHFRRRKVLKACANAHGYFVVGLCRDGVAREGKVHILVLQTFVSERPAGHDACHYDGDQSNNSLPNLRWDTAKNNIADRSRHGRTSIGSAVVQSRLIESDVPRIREAHLFGAARMDLAAVYGVHVDTIGKVINRRNWRHV